MKTIEEITGLIGQGYPPRGWKKDLIRSGWSTKKGKRFIGEKEIYQWSLDHTCAICGDGPDLDIRWLRISCFYELTEVSNKFQVQTQEDKKGNKHREYILPFCKPCRGHFMFYILGNWIKSKGHKEHSNWNGEALLQYV